MQVQEYIHVARFASLFFFFRLGYNVQDIKWITDGKMHATKWYEKKIASVRRTKSGIQCNGDDAQHAPNCLKYINFNYAIASAWVNRLNRVSLETIAAADVECNFDEFQRSLLLSWGCLCHFCESSYTICHRWINGNVCTSRWFFFLCCYFCFWPFSDGDWIPMAALVLRWLETKRRWWISIFHFAATRALLVANSSGWRYSASRVNLRNGFSSNKSEFFFRENRVKKTKPS